MKNLLTRPYLFSSTALLGGVLLGASVILYLLLFLLLHGEQVPFWAGQADIPPSLSERIDMMVLFAVAIYGVVASFLILVVGLFATHKVAGPLFRLEHLTAEAEAGRIPTQVRFRKGDQLACLAEGQARLFALLAGRERLLNDRLAEVWEAKRRLAESAGGEEWTARVEDLRSAYRSLAEVAGTRQG